MDLSKISKSIQSLLTSQKKARKKTKNRPKKTKTPIPFEPLQLDFGAQNLVATSVNSIRINEQLFPQIILEGKPKNTEYNAVRNRLLKKAFHTVRPYYEYICEVDGIKQNQHMQWVIRDIILRYIETFWDLPSSKEHHHSQEWGNLIHSLDTACRQGEKMAGEKVITANGVSSHRSQRDTIWLAFAGFLEGLLHDSGKICDAEICSTTQKKQRFNPIRGQLLDFHLIHGGNVSTVWKANRRNTKMFWNVTFLYGFVPTEVFKQMPHDIMMGLVERLVSAASLAADRESVRDWATKKNSNTAIAQAIVTLFEKNAPAFEPAKKLSGLFIEKVSPDWYMCHSKNFPYELSKEVGCTSKELTASLLGSGMLASPDNKKTFFKRLTLHKGTQALQKDVFFLRAEVIEKPLETHHGVSSENLPSSGIKISEKDKENVMNLFGETRPLLPDDAFFKQVEKQHSQKTEVKKQSTVEQTSVQESPFPVPMETANMDLSDCIPIEEPPKVAKEDISPSQTPESKVPFFEQNNISSEEAVDQFIDFLERMKPKHIQKTEKGLCWVTTTSDVLLSYPAVINAAMDIPPRQRNLSKKTKELRSKFISLLHKAQLTASDHVKNSFKYYSENEEGEVVLQSASGSFLELRFDEVAKKAPKFAKRIEQLFSCLTAMSLVNDFEPGETEDVSD